ncbi:MAG: hypothetical protein FWF04_04005, partial [Clostridiales bacterium]|nr:hypothetical protein [Clostridiales bacterium]
MNNSGSITITYDGDKERQTARGIRLAALLNELPNRAIKPVAAVVNGVLQEMDYRLYSDSNIIWLDYNSSSGHRIYKRSMVFLMLAATMELFPYHRLRVSHSLEDGLFCRLQGAEQIGKAQIKSLEARMRELTAADIPIMRSQVTRDDGANFFSAQGNEEKASLIIRRGSGNMHLYTINTGLISLTEYFFGRMAASSGLLTDFSLTPFEDGFVLCLPTRNFMGKNANKFTRPRRLQAAINEYGDWVNLLNVGTVSDLNRVIENGKFSELVLIAETLQERMMHNIANSIVADYPTVRLVLIAGPSSSGKTTFTQRMAIHLRTFGITPIAISMDDYFIDRDITPLNKEGKPDFEGVAALDMELF